MLPRLDSIKDWRHRAGKMEPNPAFRDSTGRELQFPLSLIPYVMPLASEIAL